MSRKTACAALLLTLGLIAGAGSPALAQDPEIGVDVDVPYVDPEGALAGLVTVREIEDPFMGFREDSPPAEDTRFVQLTVAFEAGDDLPFEAHPSHILLQDTDGFLWSYTTISRAPDAKPKELESQTLEAGDRVSGAIDFVVPASAVIDEVLYQPASGGRLIKLVDMSEGGTQPIGSAPVAADCEDVEVWLTTTIERLDRVTEMNLERASPQNLEPHRAEYANLAAAQGADPVPAIAQPINDQIVGALEASVAALTMLVDIDTDLGSEDTLKVEMEAMNSLSDAGAAIQDVRRQIVLLASRCGVAGPIDRAGVVTLGATDQVLSDDFSTPDRWGLMQDDTSAIAVEDGTLRFRVDADDRSRWSWRTLDATAPVVRVGISATLGGGEGAVGPMCGTSGDDPSFYLGVVNTADEWVIAKIIDNTTTVIDRGLIDDLDLAQGGTVDISVECAVTGAGGDRIAMFLGDLNIADVTDADSLGPFDRAGLYAEVATSPFVVSFDEARVAIGPTYAPVVETGPGPDASPDASASPGAEAAASLSPGVAGAEVRQWAIAAVASSQYTTTDWSADQAIGSPDAPGYGAYPTSWAPAGDPGDPEWIAVTYAVPVVPTAVHIWEANGAGFVVQVEAWDAVTSSWVTLWQGTDPTPEQLMAFSPGLTATDTPTQLIRVTAGEGAAGYPYIDAVELVGTAAP